MESLHRMLTSIRTETKAKNHLNVFREFLAHLDQAQRPQVKRPRSKPPRRRAPRRTK